MGAVVRADDPQAKSVHLVVQVQAGRAPGRAQDNDPSFAARKTERQPTWSATNANGFSFVSNPSGTTSVFAQLGHMRNGVFFDE